MASSIGPDKKELQRKLDKAKWDEDDVTKAFKHNIKVKREDLTIQESGFSVDVLAQNVTEVSRLVLLTCKLLKGSGKKQENTGLKYMYLGRTSDLNQLRECKIEFPNVTELELYECKLKTRDLSKEVFPKLEELSMKLTNIAYESTILNSLKKLRCLEFGSVELGKLQKTFRQLKELHMEGGTLVINGANDYPSWMSLRNVQFVNVVIKHKGKTLSDKKAKELLEKICPYAGIKVNHKTIHKPTLSTLLRDDDMQEEFWKACTSGVQKVHRARIMLVGHFAAGKTSLKRTLLHEAFVSRHISTVGVEASKMFEVDVNHAESFSFEKARLDHKDLLIQAVASHFVPKLDGDVVQETETEEQDKTTRDSSVCTCGCLMRLREFMNGPRISRDEPDSSSSIPDHDGQSSNNSQDEEISEMGVEMQEEIMETTLSLGEDNLREEMKAIFSIWDFGGQYVYYTSHQSFLSRSAVYLLVMDISISLDAEIEKEGSDEMYAEMGTPRTARDFLEFWLKSVHTHLVQRRTKEKATLCPPVIIVCTKTDLLDKDPEKRQEEIQHFTDSIYKQIEGKPYAEHVHKIIAFSNCDSSEAEKIELRKIIVDAAQQQPNWGEEHPNRWLLLANRLTQVRQKRKALAKEPKLQLTEVREMGAKCEIEDKELMTFLNVYHKLGDFIYFDEDGVRDTVILSPQWLADRFSTVIKHCPEEGIKKLSYDEKTMWKSGKLTPKLAKELASDDSDPDVLIQIMERFDMLIPCEANIDNNHRMKMYLVPCLLPVFPSEKKRLDGAVQPLQFKCVLSTEVEGCWLETKGFLPPGLFHRLVSSCCGTKKWDHWSQLIFYDYIEFEVTESFQFALQLSHNGITVSASSKDAFELSKLREELEELLKRILDQVFPNLSCVTFLQTKQISAETSRNHLIQVPLNKDFQRREVCRCCYKHFDLKPWENWFGLELGTKDLPSADMDTQLFPESKSRGRTLLDSMPRNVMPRNVIDKLQNHKFLTLEDIECIESEKTYRTQSILMYQKALSQEYTWNEEMCERFKEAVCVGLCQEPPAQFCPFAPEQQKPASEEQLRYLNKIRPRLIDDMDVENTIEHLYEKQILDIFTKDELDACKTRREKINKLLCFIEHVHSKAQDDFIEIIKERTKWVVVEKL